MSPELLLACRLCLRFGVQDPEQWLIDVPERIWQTWVAFFNAEPHEFGFEKAEEKQPIDQQIQAVMEQLGQRNRVQWPPQ